MLYRRLLMKQNAFDISKYFTITVTDTPRSDYGIVIQWQGHHENSIEYCLNGSSDWIEGGTNFTITLYKGQSVSFRGNCVNILYDNLIGAGSLGAMLDPDGVTFSQNIGIGTIAYAPEYAASAQGTSNTINLSGNIMSLLHGSKSDYIQNIDSYTQLYGYDFIDFLIPYASYYGDISTTEKETYYMNTFMYAHDLILPPTVERYSYAWMFGDMLVRGWDNADASLITAPKLPALSLKEGCYYGMFYDQSLLTTAPDLLADHVPTLAYGSIFSQDSSLNYIKMTARSLEITDGDMSSLLGWVDGVSNSGTFIKNSNLSLPTGGNGIPSGWTVQNV